MIKKIKDLEEAVKNGEFKVNPTVSLWGGADVIICSKTTQNTKKKIGDSKTDSNGKIIIKSKWAREISGLFYELKEIFSEQIDYANKYYFYPRLANRAKEYLAKQDDPQVLLVILEEATLIAHEWSGKLYFAYGSNMDQNQMLERCPTAKCLGKGSLDRYQFLINQRGVASIIPCEGNRVEGIIWRIFDEDEQSLDRYEGVASNCYYKDTALVKVGDVNNTCEALVYIASNQAYGFPRQGYLEKIIQAAEKFEFEDLYVEELNKWFDEKL